MKFSIVTLSTLLSLALASPAGIDKREPVVCIGCVNSKDCNYPCYMVGVTPGGAGGSCECPDDGADERYGCPKGCVPLGSACYDNAVDQNICDCGNHCEVRDLGTCQEDKICRK